MLRRNGGKALTEAAVARPPAGLRKAEVDLAVLVDGRAPPEAVTAAARRFCMTKAAARAWISRMRKRGLLRTVAIVDRARCGLRIESVAHIRIDWSHPAAPNLEAALRDDPAVTQAALTFGPFDYTAFAAHRDPHEAAAWAHWLQSQPYVTCCRVDRMQTRFKRFICAAVLLTCATKAAPDKCFRPDSSSL